MKLNHLNNKSIDLVILNKDCDCYNGQYYIEDKLSNNFKFTFDDERLTPNFWKELKKYALKNWTPFLTSTTEEQDFKLGTEIVIALAIKSNVINQKYGYHAHEYGDFGDELGLPMQFYILKTKYNEGYYVECTSEKHFVLDGVNDNLHNPKCDHHWANGCGDKADYYPHKNEMTNILGELNLNDESLEHVIFSAYKNDKNKLCFKVDEKWFNKCYPKLSLDKIKRNIEIDFNHNHKIKPKLKVNGEIKRSEPKNTQGFNQK